MCRLSSARLPIAATSAASSRGRAAANRDRAPPDRRRRARAGGKPATGAADPASSSLTVPTQLVLVGLLELLLAEDQQRIVATCGAVQLVPVAPDPRSHGAVVKAGRHVDRDFDDPANALDDAQDLALPRLAGSIAHHEAVGQPQLAPRAGERRHEHQRVLHVLPCHVTELAVDRGDLAVAASLVVEQAPERAPGVESRQAAPVDRAGRRDQRRAVAVADQAVVADGAISGGRTLARTNLYPFCANHRGVAQK